MNRNALINWSIFIFLALIWGSSFILMKISKDGLTAIQIASVRIFSAGLVFLPFSLIHIRKLQRNKIIPVILTGIAGNLVPAFFFAEAIANDIDSSLAAILNSLTPLCVVVLGLLFFKMKIQPIKIIGILIGLLGLILLSVSQKNLQFENMGYAALVLVATLSYGLNVNMVGHFLKDVNPLHAATVSLAFMCIPTGLILGYQDFFHTSLVDPQLFWPIMASVFLGVLGSAIATAFFYVLVMRAGGLFASTITYGIPFVAMGWGIIFHEEVTWVQVGCLGIILSGVYLTNKK